jgi:hypothetical protein
MALTVAGLCLIAAAPLAWGFNLVPFAHIEPNEGERQYCQDELGPGLYHFSVVEHRWVCTDNWRFLFFDAGFYGL